MTAGDVLTVLGVIVVLSMIVVAANVADRRRDAGIRRMVVGALLLVNVLIVLTYGVLPLADAYGMAGALGVETPDKEAGWAALVGSVLLAGLATACLWLPFRRWLAPLFPRPRAAEPGGTSFPADLKARPVAEPLFPQMLNYYTVEGDQQQVAWEPSEAIAHVGDERGFDPRSTVHMVALVLVLYLVGVTSVNFILSGGLAGVAESYSTGLSAIDLVVNLLPQVVIPVLGVGLGVRRSLPAIRERLGLQAPTLEGVTVAVGMAIALLMFAGVMAALWQGLVSEETFEEQTRASEALSESVDTIGLVLLLAASAAIGEELAFRGALQPVFGFWPTAIVFALTHIQYTLTPATLIILGVALVFGWLRRRYNTTVAMITHFLYNFIPLALALAVPEDMLETFIRLF